MSAMLSVPAILQGNAKVASWPDAFLLMVGANLVGAAVLWPPAPAAHIFCFPRSRANGFQALFM